MAGIVLAGAAMVVTMPAHAAQAPKAPLDLVFVIDNSGSMKITDPQFMTREAVRSFVAQLSGQCRVGLVLFDEHIRQLHPLHTLSNQQEKQYFYSSLDKIQYDGYYTNSPGGIERALYEFKHNGRPESRKAIIFITDGIVTSSSKAKNKDLIQWLKRDLIRELKLLNVRIYGIALADTADFALIQMLASRTEGEYFRAQDASKLSTAFNKIHAYLNLTETPSSPIEPVAVLPPTEIVTLPSPSEADAVSKKSAAPLRDQWMLHLSLTLIAIVLAATLFVYFSKYKQSKAEPAAAPDAPPIMAFPQARLKGLSKAFSGRAVNYDFEKAEITIGRGVQNDICIPQATISLRHATIEFKYPAYYLTDLKSTNGTLLNDNKLNGYEPVRLKSGDKIWFGKFEYRFSMADQVLFNETVMLEGTSLNDGHDNAVVMMDDNEKSDPQKALMACLKNHLSQIEATGPKYEMFVQEHLGSDACKALVADGVQNLKKTQSNHQLHYSTQVRHKIFYLVCSVPVTIKDAAKWYGATFGGFTAFVDQWISADVYQSSGCEVLCIVTFSQKSTPWVSLSIVPTHHEPDSVEVISVDFLTSEERSSMALDLGRSGEVR